MFPGVWMCVVFVCMFVYLFVSVIVCVFVCVFMYACVCVCVHSNDGNICCLYFKPVSCFVYKSIISFSVLAALPPDPHQPHCGPPPPLTSHTIDQPHGRPYTYTSEPQIQNT